MTQELGLADQLRDAAGGADVASASESAIKAVTVLGDMDTASIDVLARSALNDPDSRVRANAVEILEMPARGAVRAAADGAGQEQPQPRARQRDQALHRMKVGNVGPQLIEMLHDERASIASRPCGR